MDDKRLVKLAGIGRNTGHHRRGPGVVSGDYAYIQGHHERWLLVGETSRGRVLTVVGARSESNTYGLVTAGPASREERSFYRELAPAEGGEELGQN